MSRSTTWQRLCRLIWGIINRKPSHAWGIIHLQSKESTDNEAEEAEGEELEEETAMGLGKGNYDQSRYSIDDCDHQSSGQDSLDMGAGRENNFETGVNSQAKGGDNLTSATTNSLPSFQIHHHNERAFHFHILYRYRPVFKAVYVLIQIIIQVTSLMAYILSTISSFRVPINERNMHPTKIQIQSDNVIPLHYAVAYLDKSLTIPFTWIRLLDAISTCWITFDFILGLIFCPSLVSLVISVYTWIDLISLIPFYFEAFTLSMVTNDDTPVSEGTRIHVLLIITDYVNILRVFVVLRLIRLLRFSRAVCVLSYAVWTSLRDVIILLLLLGISTVFFGAAAFYTDKSFLSVADGAWWALVTMSTVGYGDRTPKSPAGVLVAICCIIFGLLLIAHIVPLLVNIFILYNRHADQLSAMENLNLKLQSNLMLKSDAERMIEVSEFVHHLMKHILQFFKYIAPKFGRQVKKIENIKDYKNDS
ncbi:unnamed protein product [Protopolystoma xenopodis]|uniref:Ion transport domain-containing protein n=1 Tax=Protopolystoma xenopodis TaxID=117903 RepID=A0A448WK00_9PLAT|nr:unnamed protein product [Protopolystoma xenopodis]